MDYIDPHNYVKEIASTLAENMTNYQHASSDTYIAPYTSLVTSSMMGKTRLIKEYMFAGGQVNWVPAVNGRIV